MLLPGLTLALVLAPGEGLARRGNDAVVRERGPVYTVGLSLRLGVLTGDGTRVMQPIGFGMGFDFRVHALRLGPIRLGALVHLGHSRYLDRREVVSRDTGQRALRYAALGHSDFTAGPSAEVVIGPLVVQLGCGVGLGISTFVRPFGPYPNEEQKYDDLAPMLRGTAQIGIPIRNGHGVVVGVGVHKYFSKLLIAAEPPLEGADGSAPPRDTNPFDMMIDLSLGYAFTF